jgi:hypothetical protein
MGGISEGVKRTSVSLFAIGLELLHCMARMPTRMKGWLCRSKMESVLSKYPAVNLLDVCHRCEK